MCDYISREAIIDEFEEEMAFVSKPVDRDALINKGLRIALKDIKNQPAADVQPVKHGRWICNEELYYNGMTKCSCCNEEYYTEDIQNLQEDLRTVNYCPNCGARMDGDAE